MKRAVVVLLLLFSACHERDPGPLPAVSGRHEKVDYKKFWFPTNSVDPLPLDIALQNGDVSQVRRLLELGTNPNLRWGDSGDHFPLQESIESIARGSEVSTAVETVSLLLKHGADPNARWCMSDTRGPSEWRASCTADRGTTPLVFSAFAGYRDITELLLAAGADPSARDFTGRSPLDYASDEIVFELVSRALFPDLATRDRKALEWLKRAGGDAYEPSRSSTPLLRALLLADDGQFVFNFRVFTFGIRGEDKVVSRVRILMRLGADPNERLTERAPLSYALSNQWLRVARVLLQNGADVNQRWCERFPAPWIAPGYAPKHLIVRPGEPSDDPACNSKNGMTPLMWSAASGDRNAVALLLEFNADRSLIDWAGRSAVHYAVWRDVWDLLKSAPSGPTPH
jgi:ankyrin repeat protein